MSKSRLAAVVAAISFLSMPLASHAANVHPAWENEFSGSASYTDIEDVTFTSAEFSFGRYLTQMHELGINVAYMRVEISGLGSVDGTEIGPFYHLNFPTDGNAVPFIGINANWIGGDLNDAYDYSYGVSAGVKVYPYEHAGLVFSVAYQRMNGAQSYINDANGTSANIGVVIRF